MAQYVTPFLVFNVGAEMIFVIAQRLQAQKVPPERATLVLEELISELVSKQLTTEIMKPQAAYCHDAIRDIIEDITQSSQMRLDPVSMGKLWDLITMVFKWQVTLSKNIIQITLRHLYEIENYVTNEETQLQLHKIQNLVENFEKILSKDEKRTLFEDISFWLKDFSVRVSLLLRMGLQSMDGHFIKSNLDPIAEEMLKNLGENIYAVTQNGKILEESNNNPELVAQPINELQLFVEEMLGERKLSSASSNDGNVLRLSINDNDNYQNNNEETKVGFDAIDVDVIQREQLMSDIGVDAPQEDDNFRDNLLDLIVDS